MTNEAYDQRALINFKEFMQYGSSPNSCFGVQLYNLIMKADSSNLFKLKMGFPKEVRVWEDYKGCKLNEKGELNARQR